MLAQSVASGDSRMAVHGILCSAICSQCSTKASGMCHACTGALAARRDYHSMHRVSNAAHCQQHCHEVMGCQGSACCEAPSQLAGAMLTRFRTLIPACIRRRRRTGIRRWNQQQRMG